jgi:tetrapyrrole methylase family protein/MazG family protein
MEKINAMGMENGNALPDLSMLQDVYTKARQAGMYLSSPIQFLSARDLSSAVLHGHGTIIVADISGASALDKTLDKLLTLYGEQAECLLITRDGSRKYHLANAVGEHFQEYITLVVPQRDEETALMDFYDLLSIIRRLRAPDGCPWDREQTHASLRQCLIEECYEAAEAIDRQKWDELANELGDVLLQVVLHGQIGQEAGTFSTLAVTNEICRKMIYRHPHVFSDGQASTGEEVLQNWEELKRKEKKQESLSQTLDGVAKALPALVRSQKVLDKLAKAGKPLQEIEVFQREKDLLSDSPKQRAKEGGERLLRLVEQLRLATVDSEQALHEAVNRRIAALKAEEALEK